MLRSEASSICGKVGAPLRVAWVNERWTRWKALEESARRLVNGEVRRVDIGKCNEKHFLLWSGIGIDAFIVHRIEPRKQWEKNFTLVRYGASAVLSASQWQGVNIRVLADGMQVEGKYMLVEVSNIRLYAGGLATLSPQATLDDGLMELWLFDGNSMEDVLQQAWSLWSGKHIESEKVKSVQFKQIVLESDAPIYLQMDGEPEISNTKVEVSVLHRQLKVMVPDQAPASLFRHTQ